MTLRRSTLFAFGSVLVAACAGDEAAPRDESRRTPLCAPDSQSSCNCVDGAQGLARCQLDGTYSACDCSARPGPTGPRANTPGAIPATSGAAGADAAPAPPPRPAAGPSPGAAPAAPGTAAAAPPAAAPTVKVDPADVAACNGMGAAPSPDEAVEVLKIRTSDVVPSGFAAAGGTVYACFWAEIDMPEKRHIIGWEGAIGGDRAVHHQQVSLGTKPFYLLQQGGLCGLPSVEYTWTGERPPEWTPIMAGYPIGGPENGGKARFLWQTHFEGATTFQGGFNAYVTKKLRKYDAGNFEQGDVRGINIPAKAAATHEARCTTEMTKQKFSYPIYVFASMGHAHLTVKRIKSQQFRNGMLLNTLGDQTTNGFAGFFDQSFKPHSPCIEVLPGDELVTTCDYQNPWDAPVMGGEATNQEMCTTFMQYFPRLPKPSDNFCGTIDSSGGFTP